MVVFLLHSRIYYMHYAPHPGPREKFALLKINILKVFINFLINLMNV